MALATSISKDPLSYVNLFSVEKQKKLMRCSAVALISTVNLNFPDFFPVNISKTAKTARHADLEYFHSRQNFDSDLSLVKVKMNYSFSESLQFFH